MKGRQSDFKESLSYPMKTFDLRNYLREGVPDNTIMQSDFVSCEAIDEKMKQLRETTENCRLMALSGMAWGRHELS